MKTLRTEMAMSRETGWIRIGAALLVWIAGTLPLAAQDVPGTPVDPSDPVLRDALRDLYRDRGLRKLVRQVREGSLTVVFSEDVEAALFRTDFPDHLFVNPRLGQDVETLADALVHEGAHRTGFLRRGWPTPEMGAYRAQWSYLYKRGIFPSGEWDLVRDMSDGELRDWIHMASPEDYPKVHPGLYPSEDEWRAALARLGRDPDEVLDSLAPGSKLARFADAARDRRITDLLPRKPFALTLLGAALEIAASGFSPEDLAVSMSADAVTTGALLLLTAATPAGWTGALLWAARIVFAVYAGEKVEDWLRGSVTERPGREKREGMTGKLDALGSTDD